MAVYYVRALIVICLLQKCLSFILNENTADYVDLTNDLPPPVDIFCACPDTAICDCEYDGKTYSVDAPFAAHLMDPPSAMPWLPSLYPLPNDFPVPFRVLTGIEQPLPQVKLMPRPYDKIKARFKLFFKENNKISPLLYLEINDLSAWPHWYQSVNSPAVLYVVIHGWTGSDLDLTIRSLRAYLLLHNEHPNSALISVNWTGAATGSYRQSAADSLVIGREVGLMIYTLVESQRIKAEHVHLIGVDMGSHIAKIATNLFSRLASINKLNSTSKDERIGRRTGLNPFATYFDEVDGLESRYDADYVDIIHTSTSRHGGDIKDILHRDYGISTLHLDPNNNYNPSQVDFYPNKGDWRGDCDDDVYGCGLNIAIAYFKASLRNDYRRTEFETYPNVNVFKRDFYGIPRTTGVMGIEAPTRSRKGNQYLKFRIPRTTHNPDTHLVSGPPCTHGPRPVHVNPQSLLQCGMSRAPEQRIFKGVPALQEQFPWAVCILTNYIGYFGENLDPQGDVIPGKDFWPRDAEDNLPPESNMRGQVGYAASCSATLIERSWVLTAAHCFKKVKNLIPIYLVFGSVDCMHPASPDHHVRRVIVEKRDGRPEQTVFIHESYPVVETPIIDAAGDIALIRLTTPVEPDLQRNINTICYREAVSYPYGDCSRIQNAGYGLKGDGSDDPRLTWMRSNIIQPDNPRHSFVNRPKYGLEVDEMYTRFKTVIQFASFEEYRPAHPQGRAICPGDSGGPIMDYNLGNKTRATLIGLVKSGVNCIKASVRQRRSTIDPTYVEDDDRGQCWRRVLATGTKLRPYVKWITEKFAKTNNPFPNDKFFNVRQALELGIGPKFGKQNRPVVAHPPNSWYDFDQA